MNTAPSNPSPRLLITGATGFIGSRFVLHAHRQGLDVIGYYHSHPNAPAVPSQYDLDHALPVWSYIIASVSDGKTVDVRSWEMENDRSRFNEEQIEKVSMHSE